MFQVSLYNFIFFPRDNLKHHPLVTAVEGADHPRGDKLNLKSKLAQYYSLANIFTGENGTISDVTLSVPNPDDAVKFMEFMINGDGEAVRTTKTA